MRAAGLRVLTVGMLAAVWVLLWGRLSVANVLGGLAVAALIMVLLPVPRVPVQGLLHPVALLRLLARIGWYLVLSSLHVAWLAIRPGPPPRNGVLRIQLAIKSDLVLVWAANITTMIPGSIVLEIDQVHRILYYHVLDVGSPRSVAQFRGQVATLERLLVAAFERDSEWRP